MKMGGGKSRPRHANPPGGSRTGGPERGSVSIYMIAAVAGFVLLGALLIDFSRIAAFRHTSALAVQSGVRSVLSSYDPEFYEKYGLFIRGGDAGDELFRTAVEGHFADRESSAALAYLDAEWLEAGVIESRPLADHNVFRQQVLEEMKYKAPVDLALELAERFRGVAPELRETAATVDLLERMRKAFERRETELDRVLAVQARWGEAVLAPFRELAPELQDAARKYGQYLAQRRALAELAGDADPMMRQALALAVSSYESRVSELAASLSAAGERVHTETESLASEAAEALERAKTINGEMRGLAEEASGTLQEAGAEADKGSSASGELAKIRETAKQLVLEEKFFSAYGDELQTQADRSRGLAREADRAAAVLSHLGSAGSSLSTAAASFQGELNRYSAAYGGNGSIIRERRATIQNHRARDGERKALEKEAEKEWAGWQGVIGGLRSVQGTAEERESFQKIDGLSQANLDWNQAAEVSASQADPPDPSGGRDAALAQTNGWLEALDEALAGKRDDLYFSEYAHARFSRLSPADVKRMLDREDVRLSIANQQAEYILYGFAHPAGNIAAAYGEIFAFRLAVRTLEGLLESRNLGHPLVILAAALVYGVRHAVQDMHSLLNEDAVQLSKYVDAKTSYADYLRLFYLLHGGSPDTMSRFIAVMEHDTGIALTRSYTCVGGEGTASLRLWFFPGLLQMMGRTGHLGGTVKGNRYEADFTAESSYQ